MDIYKHSPKDDITATQKNLQRNFLPSDTWGIVEIEAAPKDVESKFVAALCSAAAAKVQADFEQLTQIYPDKYGHPAPAGSGKTEYSVFQSGKGTRILFVTNFSQKPVKGIVSKKTIGAAVKVHTAKIQNRFEPTGWKKASWFFVAHALITGNDDEFASVSRYT